MKKFILIVAALAVIGTIAWYAIRGRSEKTTYKEFKVTRGDIRQTILASGTVKPENRLEIKPPIAGRVEQVLVNEGQKVRKGQILAWMSSTERAALLDGVECVDERERHPGGPEGQLLERFRGDGAVFHRVPGERAHNRLVTGGRQSCKLLA